MDFLVLSPPACPPSEPPSGAFALACALAGHGREAGLLDLSLEFYHRVLEDCRLSDAPVERAIDYLVSAGSYREPNHRSAAGQIHRHLRGFDRAEPGWKLTLMDCAPPWRLHDLGALAHWLEEPGGPFEDLWEEALLPVLERERPSTVVISLSYLSQLVAAADLAAFLRRRGISPVVGGSLPRSLAATGEGIGPLEGLLGEIDLTDGSGLIGDGGDGPFLSRLSWPRILSGRPYLSARPVIPLTLSTGCHWRRCLFCPDRHMEFVPLDPEALGRFLETIPAHIAGRGPVVHLLDSAMPPKLLRRFAPVARQFGVSYYGFARPTGRFLDDGFLEELAGSGCAMLQLGVESGSARLLDRFDKGLDPALAARVVRTAARAGIRIYAYMLFGLPGETGADREATLEMIRELDGAVDFLNLSLFNLPRHTELTDRADEFGIELGRFPGGDELLRLYSPFTCRGEDTRKSARLFLKERFLAVPEIKRMHLRTPRWFRAAHMAMMDVEGRRPL